MKPILKISAILLLSLMPATASATTVTDSAMGMSVTLPLHWKDSTLVSGERHIFWDQSGKYRSIVDVRRYDIASNTADAAEWCQIRRNSHEIALGPGGVIQVADSFSHNGLIACQVYGQYNTPDTAFTRMATLIRNVGLGRIGYEIYALSDDSSEFTKLTNWDDYMGFFGDFHFFEPAPDPQPVPPPDFNPMGGDFNDSVKVTLSSISGASMYFTLDGNEPTTSSQKYTDALIIQQTCSLKAIAVKAGMINSTVTGAAFDITTISIRSGEIGQIVRTDLTPSVSNGQVRFSFVNQGQSDVNLNVYDMLGRNRWSHIVDGTLRGAHRVIWHPAGTIPSGVYIVSLKNDNRILTRNFTYVK